MKLIIRLIISTIAVLVTDLLLSGIHADDFVTGLIVAVVLALLNTIVRPLLIVFTLPITILSMGLFLLVINAAMVKLADRMIDGFNVDSWWWALGFSLVLSVVQGFLNALDGGEKRKEQ